MGADLAGAFATAREVFGEVDEALKQNLSKLMREGPESDLVLTENAQPALMTVSVAVARILEKAEASRCRRSRPMSRATRSASTRPLPRPAP
jgi:(acyl-carrier-protein) S-malonyltransferase